MAKRPIFQEVSSATPVLQPTANLIETAPRGARGATADAGVAFLAKPFSGAALAEAIRAAARQLGTSR